MKKFAIPILAVLLIAFGVPAAAQEPSPPSETAATPTTLEDLLLQYHEAKLHGDHEMIVYLLHPDFQEEMQTGMLDLAEKFPEGEKRFLEKFSVDSLDELRFMQPQEFLLQFVKLGRSAGEPVDELEVVDVEILGTVRDKGDEYVVYRTTVMKGDVEVTQLEVLTCRRHQGEYRVVMVDDMQGEYLAIGAEMNR